MTDDIQNRRMELAKLIDRHLDQDSYQETAVPSLFFNPCPSVD